MIFTTVNKITDNYLEIEPKSWQDTEGDGSRLLASVWIGGKLHHLEAARVKRDISGIQWGTSPMAQMILTDLWTADGGAGDGRFNEVKIEGFVGSYVLMMVPGRE